MENAQNSLVKLSLLLVLKKTIKIINFEIKFLQMISTAYKKGLLNDYRPGMPLSEIILKDILFFIKQITYYIKNGFKTRTILAYPEFPSRNSTFYKIASKLNYNITNRIKRKYSLVIYWEDTTIRSPGEEISKLAQNHRIINYKARNISKTLVEQKHNEIFGYSTRINPNTYQGKCVKKSDFNAAHDGQIIQCPIKQRENGSIYQKLIDNTYDEKYVIDIRVPIIGEKIPLVYLKYKPLKNRFDNFRTTKDIKLPELHKPENVFTEDEIAKILGLANKMNIEFGEMDILRDNHDNKIYVVDVNNTPTGPSHLRKHQLKKALNLLSEAFRTEFIYNFEGSNIQNDL